MKDTQYALCFIRYRSTVLLWIECQILHQFPWGSPIRFFLCLLRLNIAGNMYWMDDSYTENWLPALCLRVGGWCVCIKSNEHGRIRSAPVRHHEIQKKKKTTRKVLVFKRSWFVFVRREFLYKKNRSYQQHDERVSLEAKKLFDSRNFCFTLIHTRFLVTIWPSEFFSPSE